MNSWLVIREDLLDSGPESIPYLHPLELLALTSKDFTLSYVFCKYKLYSQKTLVTLLGIDLCQLAGKYVGEIEPVMEFPTLRIIPRC